MEEIFGAIFRAIIQFLMALVYWRVLLCVGITLCIVFPMMHFSLGMNGFQAMVFVAIGWFFGLGWTEIAYAKKPTGTPPAPPVPEQTALWLAALGAGFMGYVWGALSSLTLASAIFGAIVLAITCRLVYVWRSRAHGFSIPPKYTAVCVTSAWIGYISPIFQFGKFY